LEKSSESLQIGDCLARWAPATSEATLSELSKVALGLANSWNGNSANWANFVAAPFGRLVTDRLLLGDRSALSDYESAIPRFIPAGWIQSGAFSPLWSFSQDPEMESVARRYMDSLTKRLNTPDPQVAVETVENFVRGSVHSPLLSLPPFRELLVSGFSNDAKVGDGWVDSASHAMMYFRLETRGTSLLSLPSDVNPPSGVHIDVRVGDYIANIVAGIKGAPVFCMIWPIEKRNAAKTKLIQWLRDDRRNWLATAKDSPLYSE
jgi:hypothetical protein